MPDYVTVEIAAALVGKDKSTIYAWIRNEELAVFKSAHGVTRVEQSQLMDVDASKRHGRPAGARPPQLDLPDLGIAEALTQLIAALSQATFTLNRYMETTQHHD